MPLLTLRPNPVPFSGPLVVKKDSKTCSSLSSGIPGPESATFRITPPPDGDATLDILSRPACLIASAAYLMRLTKTVQLLGVDEDFGQVLVEIQLQTQGAHPGSGQFQRLPDYLVDGREDGPAGRAPGMLADAFDQVADPPGALPYAIQIVLASRQVGRLQFGLVVELESQHLRIAQGR
jgi:hypothetical protein